MTTGAGFTVFLYGTSHAHVVTFMHIILGSILCIHGIPLYTNMIPCMGTFCMVHCIPMRYLVYTHVVPCIETYGTMFVHRIAKGYMCNKEINFRLFSNTKFKARDCMVGYSIRDK